MTVAEQQSAWIRRVLGVGDSGEATLLLPIWRNAKDVLDEQIGGLQRALHGTQHPIAVAIADRGLAGLTGGTMTPLIAALIDYDGASGQNRAGAAAKLRRAVARLRQRIDSERVFSFVDTNPFGVSVAVRSVMTKALDAIEQGIANGDPR